MHSITVWKLAKSPNYDTNVDKLYPYSEVPYLGQYKLLKIPVSLNNLIDHVDYWGEGRIVSESGVSGFTNCYNVNHPYQLVSNGPDRDRKIPNRIPVLSYTNCDTSAYIKDSSVLVVTVMGSPINSSCATDIARLVNDDLGKVVVYGFDPNSQYVTNLKQELAKKGLFFCPGYVLPDKLKGLTLFKPDEYRVYVNLSELKDEIYEKVINGVYEAAVEMSKDVNSEISGNIMSDVVIKLLNNNQNNIMMFAYKLWHGGAQDVLKKYFPAEFKLIFNEDPVTIINKGYQQALKLDAHTDSYNDRLAWGDAIDKSSVRVKWNLIPVWQDNNVVFKLYNTNYDMFMKLDANSDSLGDRKAWGSTNSDETRHKYYLQPMLKNHQLVFIIRNYQYHQALKLAVAVDGYGDRLLWGHNDDGKEDVRGSERFHWIFTAL